MDATHRLFRRWQIIQTLAILFAVAVVMASAAVPAVAEDGDALANKVTIRRTEYGVPHIQAETLEAVAFGFGYCQAEDHLINIMRGMLGARGELALAFGPDDSKPGDGKNLAADFRSRQYRIYARAVENYHRMDPDYRSMVEGFAAGLNYYVAGHRDDVPEWIPTLTPHDVTAYGFAGVMRFAFDRGGIVRDFLKSQRAATARIDEPAELLADPDAELGSNMWALAPSRSRTGRTLLLGNPHQGWAPVSTYYEAHLIVPGKMNFYGSTFIGRPVLTTGWNEHLGWSHTVNYPDLEEIYELDLDAARPEHYLFDGGSVPIDADEVTVRIKSDGKPTSETRTFWHTPLGPVIHRSDDKVWVLRSACYENYQAYEQWLKMCQAQNYQEFRDVLAITKIPMFNICYADRDGNIMYLWNGTVPDLPHPAHKAEAVPAARTADIWTTFHPLKQLPQLFNPTGGYVQNCNSPPYYGNLQARLPRENYPLHFPANNLSLRTQHSLRLVDNDEKFTLEQVRDMKHSPLMLGAERVKPSLIQALRDSQPNSEVASAIEVLESWDNTVSAESRGGTLFENWWNRYIKGTSDKFGVAWNEAEPTSSPRELADPAGAVQAFTAALDEVTQNFGRADVAWGTAHRIRKGSVDLPVSGGSGLAGCFRVLGFQEAEDHKLVANTGDSWVFAVEFSDPPQAYTVVAYSQSDVESSPHFADQAALFSAGKMKRAAFTDSEIAAQLPSTYHPGKE